MLCTSKFKKKLLAMLVNRKNSKVSTIKIHPNREKNRIEEDAHLSLRDLYEITVFVSATRALVPSLKKLMKEADRYQILREFKLLNSKMPNQSSFRKKAN